MCESDGSKESSEDGSRHVFDLPLPSPPPHEYLMRGTKTSSVNSESVRQLLGRERLTSSTQTRREQRLKEHDCSECGAGVSVL
ncbi:hypothetical protein CesoFtcFv8_005855 [Champsocephalus esox]|uniref:Uncharacterized protein n=1 Tax=Champsocephalus esox TaxID=159716 RepID=A0AAN8CMT8_9TELE|nr:hypothetical protein CesoFtcFv8_005855 [Champsocephalus esox]